MWGARRPLELVSTSLPLLVVIDDIQSAEQTFLDFLDLMLESPEQARILLLCTSRHELQRAPPGMVAGARRRDDHASAPTTPQPGQLLDQLLGDLEPAVCTRIATIADGNPLYAEQIVSMLQETGAIRREGDRWISVREGRTWRSRRRSRPSSQPGSMRSHRTSGP